MPNHVINEVTFKDVSAEEQEAILLAACNQEGEVDFSVLAPAPLNMWMGNVGQQHERAFGRTGLDWAKENWGTKWNAYSHQPTQRSDSAITLIFETAWRPPYPWLAALLNRLSLPFEHHWLDEGASRARSGRFEVDGRFGPEWTEAEADDEAHRRLHKLHWGVESFEDEDA